jgi:hypothetical protein
VKLFYIQNCAVYIVFSTKFTNSNEIFAVTIKVDVAIYKTEPLFLKKTAQYSCIWTKNIDKTVASVFYCYEKSWDWMISSARATIWVFKCESNRLKKDRKILTSVSKTGKTKFLTWKIPKIPWLLFKTNFVDHPTTKI